jgi:ABC-type cobalt transport system substrate-binding protein
MDFLINILVVIIILLLLFNFSSITISDTQYGGTCSRESNNKRINNVPKPVNSAQNKAVNGKINIDDHTYDYRKYFFVR